MTDQYDLICFSHIPWELVAERSQHLLAHAVRHHRVFFVEEALREEGPAGLSVYPGGEGVTIVRPIVPRDAIAEAPIIRALLDDLIEQFDVDRFVLWFYTPTALPYAHHLEPIAVVYDCIDELAGAVGSFDGVAELDGQLLSCADLVVSSGTQPYQTRHTWPAMSDLLADAIDERAAATAASRTTLELEVLDETDQLLEIDELAPIHEDVDLFGGYETNPVLAASVA
jgi:hypothetical protein